MVKYPILTIIILFIFSQNCIAQNGKNKFKKTSDNHVVSKKKKIIKYGIASFYANKFNGRKTANDEIFQNEKYTAACNQLPFNTWIKVTNLKNKKSVIVRINDRLHPQNKRLVDLSRAAARDLGIIARGIAKVKVEVLVLGNYSINKRIKLKEGKENN
jgi:rare lipoprotein A